MLSSNLSGLARIIDRNHFKHKLRKEDDDLSTFDFAIIARATGNFAKSNKLGEGGFGPVYKVIWETCHRCFFLKMFLTIVDVALQARLLDGQEFAVKRLSNKSGQGLEELKNNVVLIAKLSTCQTKA